MALSQTLIVSYKSCVFLKESELFSSFKEALKDLIVRVRAKVKEADSVSFQLLETACWIERTTVPGGARAIGFYDARDLGFKVGLLLGESEFVESVSEPDKLLLAEVFAQGEAAKDFIDALPALASIS